MSNGHGPWAETIDGRVGVGFFSTYDGGGYEVFDGRSGKPRTVATFECLDGSTPPEATQQAAAIALAERISGQIVYPWAEVEAIRYELEQEMAMRCPACRHVAAEKAFTVLLEPEPRFDRACPVCSHVAGAMDFRFVSPPPWLAERN